MKKRKILIISGLLLALTLTIGGTHVYTLATERKEASQKESTKISEFTVVVDNDGLQSGKDQWIAFVGNCNSQKKGKVIIKYNYDLEALYSDAESVTPDMLKQPEESSIFFDGESYCYSAGKNNKKYKHLLLLPNKESTLVILSDEKLSSEQVNKSMYSSNSEDIKQFELIFSY